jgi:hypothetical protein
LPNQDSGYARRLALLSSHNVVRVGVEESGNFGWPSAIYLIKGTGISSRCRLSELHRFADPAEAAATLAVRYGRSEALGFYLDLRRVHVGDLSTAIDSVFNRLAGRPRPWSRRHHLGFHLELVRNPNQRSSGSPPRWHHSGAGT